MTTSQTRITYKANCSSTHPLHEAVAKFVKDIPVLKNLNFGGVYMFAGESCQLAHIQRFFQELAQRFPNTISE